MRSKETLKVRRSGVGIWPLLAIAAVLALGLPASVGAATLYVSTSGSDVFGCGSQGSPCQNPDYALNAAVNGDTIKVAAGTYFFANNQNICDAGGVQPILRVICVIDKQVTVRGGFSPTTWAFNPSANPTIIDGQNTDRGAFVYSSGAAPTRLTMANLTIQNCRALAPNSDPGAFGGGIEVQNAALTLDNVTFSNNTAIGANVGTAGGSAAGSAVSIRSTPAGMISILTGVRFQANTSTGGQGAQRGGFAFGPLFVFAATVHVENSQFISNTAQAGSSSGSGDVSGARADALGGAIAVEGGGTVTISRVTATGNTVTGGSGSQFGGGAFGGGVYVEDSAATIADSRFESNVSQAAAGAGSSGGGFAGGGGVMLFNSNGSIDRSLFLANRASGGASGSGNAGSAGGGGLYLWKGRVMTLATIPVRNSVFADNRSELGATGLNPGGGGGGVQVQGLTATFEHVTFNNNQLGPGLVVGQAMTVVEAPGVSPTNVTLNHSVVSNHEAATGGATALVVTATNTLTLSNGRFSANSHDINDNNVPVGPGTINGLSTMQTISSPDYTSPASPTFDLHIASWSLLRDAASGSTMTVDLDSQGRTDGSPDIGADEFVSTSCTSGGATDSDLDGIPDTVETTEGTRACSKDNDLFSSARLFAMQQYRDFLERESDADGLLFWMGSIAGGNTRAAVTKSFIDSPEFQGVVAPVVRLYFAYFNRIPDLAGLQYWIGQHRAGMSLNNISEAFAQSPEFQATYGSLSNSQFVTLLYQNVLGRQPDQAGLDYWTGQLDSSAMTRGAVMVGFSESPEYGQLSYNRVFVTMVYYGMLRRVPDVGGFDFWVAQLNGGASALDLINGFLGAAEYRGRFLS